MIVVKGKSQKSIVLENLIRKSFMTNSVLIIDSVGIPPLFPEGEFEHVLVKVDSYKELIELFEREYEEYTSKYDWIAFYVNSDVSSIEDFKALDRKYVQNFIITIQDVNGLTNTYYI